jgi:general secretion pathway protein L
MPAADRFSHLAQDLQLRLARSPLPGYGRDALQALRSLLPARWRDWIEGENLRLLLVREGGQLSLVSAGSRGQRALGQVPLDDAGLLQSVRDRLDEGSAPRWLLLPPEAVLRRVLSLPEAAQPRLREVLAFELDRQTPFTAAEVSYEGRVLSRDAASGQLQVQLTVLPRSRLEAELAALGPLAPGLAGVDVLAPDGGPQGLNLLPEARRAHRMDPVRRLNLALAGVAAFCLVATLLLSLHNRSQRLESLRQEVAQATIEAREARLLRNQLQTASQAANFLAAHRAGRPTMLEVLDDLTRRIPDDTAMDKLAINDDVLVLVGLSRSAPALVGLLQESPLLVSPALSGPVQADPRAGRDRFTLNARIVVREPAPEAADAPAP